MNNIRVSCHQNDEKQRGFTTHTETAVYMSPRLHEGNFLVSNEICKFSFSAAESVSELLSYTRCSFDYTNKIYIIYKKKTRTCVYLPIYEHKHTRILIEKKYEPKKKNKYLNSHSF